MLARSNGYVRTINEHEPDSIQSVGSENVKKKLFFFLEILICSDTKNPTG